MRAFFEARLANGWIETVEASDAVVGSTPVVSYFAAAAAVKTEAGLYPCGKRKKLPYPNSREEYRTGVWDGHRGSPR